MKISKIKFEEDKRQVREAWKFLRLKNSSVPNEIIDLMRDAALEVIEKREQIFEFKHEFPKNLTQEEMEQMLRHPTPKI